MNNTSALRLDKIATIDIETLPGTYRAYVDKWWKAQMRKEVAPVKLASLGYKYHHLAKIHVIAYWEYETYEDFLKAVWDVLDNCEFIVGHNAKKFDLRQLHSFFAAHGFPKPRCKVIDTLTIVRREFRLPMYKLKYVADYFGVGQKIETGGDVLWFEVEEGNEAARKHFIKYNANDVRITELLFKKLQELGYAKLPGERVLFRGACIRCGGTEYKLYGNKTMHDGVWKYVQCLDEDCRKTQPFYLIRRFGQGINH